MVTVQLACLTYIAYYKPRCRADDTLIGAGLGSGSGGGGGGQLDETEERHAA